MAKNRKSPQEKKRLEYERDHFTPGFNSSRAFPNVWKRKKARVNREARRKADGMLAAAKNALAREEVEVLAEDLTPARLRKSITRERLHKVGTVSLGEKIKLNLEQRLRSANRKVKRDKQHDFKAEAAVRTMTSLRGSELLDFVRRAEALCGQRDMHEFKRVLGTRSPVNSALYFLYQLSVVGSAFEVSPLRRNPGLNRVLQSWLEKANRMIVSDQRTQENRRGQKEAARLRNKASRKS
jgi:hypothetical protein